METQRLLRLAEHLEALRPNGCRLFNLDIWYGLTSCGTTACAGGEACLVPEFKCEGLRLNSGSNCYPIYGQSFGFRALADFFAIYYSDASELFNPNEYSVLNDPKIVARRIRAFVARGRRPHPSEALVPLCHVYGVSP